MKLPFIKKRSDSSPREYLFALEIGHETVKSAIWSVVNNKTQVLAIGSPVAWDESLPEQLITAGDQTLSDATTHLDQTGSTQPQKLVLGLPADWVTEDKIHPEKLSHLKNLTQKLSLSAIGFVVTSQAIVRHLHHVEGVPPTAILVGFGERFLEVTLVRLGKVNATHLVSRSGSVPADIIEGLSRFGKLDMLPSRILIYDSASDLENVRQQLLSYPWQAPQTKLPFLHFPKIEVLPSDFSIKAISLSGGSEVAQSIGLIPAPAKVEPAIEAPPAPTQVTASELGFFPDVDVAQTQAPPDKPPASDISPEAKRLKLPRLSLPAIKLPKNSILPLGVIIVMLLIFGLGSAYWFLPQADVTLMVSAKTLQQQFDITADSDATDLDVEAQVLPAKTLEVSVSGTSSKNTTGTQLVGDKAVGEVTVINGTPVSRNFPAGTTLTAPGGLKFTLDASVEVASASGTADPNSYQPGKANVKVTATEIGSDSNLSAGTQFSIGTFSTLDFIAKNETAFTGGSSRQVAAVSKQDLSDLKSQLFEQLKNESKEKLANQQLSTDENLVDNSINFEIQSEEYAGEEGDVADQVQLDLSLKATALAYSQPQLDELVTSQISSQIPSGYQIQGQPQTQLSINTDDLKQLVITVDVTATLLPDFDIENIRREITGKSPAQAKNIISQLPNISEVSMSFTPRLPPPLLSLPHQSKNIRITVQPQ